MKSLATLIVFAVLAVCASQAEARHRVARVVVVRPQRVVVQRFVAAPVVHSFHAQQFVAPVVVQPFVQSYGVQQFVAPVQQFNGHSCNQFFRAY